MVRENRLVKQSVAFDTTGLRSAFVDELVLIAMRRDIPTSLLPSVADSRLMVQQLGEQTAILDCCAGIGGFSMGVAAATGASVPLAVENDADIHWGALRQAASSINGRLRGCSICSEELADAQATSPSGD